MLIQYEQVYPEEIPNLQYATLFPFKFRSVVTQLIKGCLGEK